MLAEVLSTEENFLCILSIVPKYPQVRYVVKGNNNSFYDKKREIIG
jgi:hypothetical protein